MNCFLLELRVILHEYSNVDLNGTIENVMLLANSSLSSNKVSYPPAIVSCICWFGITWDKAFIRKRILLWGPQERIWFQRSGLQKWSQSCHTQNPKFVDSVGKQAFLSSCSQCALERESCWKGRQVLGCSGRRQCSQVFNIRNGSSHLLG